MAGWYSYLAVHGLIFVFRNDWAYFKMKKLFTFHKYGVAHLIFWVAVPYFLYKAYGYYKVESNRLNDLNEQSKNRT